MAAQYERGKKLLDDPGLYNFADWMTYGLLSANQQRFNEADDLYGYANWALSGAPDMIKGTFANDRPLSFDHWMNSFGTAGLAFGGYYSSKNLLSNNSLFIENSSEYLSSNRIITNDILDKPRVGSALTIDKIKPKYSIDPLTGKTYMSQEFPATAQAHGFNNIVDNYAGYAIKSQINNGTLYQLEGSLNHIPGRFEWIIQDGNVTHRMFVEYGTINGVPIKP